MIISCSVNDLSVFRIHVMMRITSYDFWDTTQKFSLLKPMTDCVKHSIKLGILFHTCGSILRELRAANSMGLLKEGTNE